MSTYDSLSNENIFKKMKIYTSWENLSPVDLYYMKDLKKVLSGLGIQLRD
jgi:hypothetical protein